MTLLKNGSRSLPFPLLAAILSWSLAGGAVKPVGDRNLLVVTASGGDYLVACGGTLASYARQGYKVYVAQFGNDEKVSLGLGQAQTRLSNISEAKEAAHAIGVTDMIFLDHKSGELAYTSSTEMRHQLFGLIRYIKPRILFIPDPYVHYQEDRDVFWIGKMAEDAWGYSGGGMFGNDLTRYGLTPYGAPDVFYYAPARPYRPGEGGDGRSKFVARDVSSTLDQKLIAVELMHTRNRFYAETVRQKLPGALPGGLADDLDAARLMRAYVTELAETIGSKHGFRFGEEFNHVGGAGEAIPPYALERATPRKKP